MSKNSVAFIPLTTLDASLINAGTWRVINPTGLPNACSHLTLINDSDTSVTFSTDEATQMAYLGPNSQLVLPVEQAATPAGWVAKFAAGTIFYAKGTAGTGTIAIVGLYNKN